MKEEKYYWHAGGCEYCTQQETHPIEFCMNCQYFDADWGLPDLNNKRQTREGLKRAELIIASEPVRLETNTPTLIRVLWPVVILCAVVSAGFLAGTGLGYLLS